MKNTIFSLSNFILYVIFFENSCTITLEVSDLQKFINDQDNLPTYISKIYSCWIKFSIILNVWLIYQLSYLHQCFKNQTKYHYPIVLHTISLVSEFKKEKDSLLFPTNKIHSLQHPTRILLWKLISFYSFSKRLNPGTSSDNNRKYFPTLMTPIEIF